MPTSPRWKRPSGATAASCSSRSATRSRPCSAPLSRNRAMPSERSRRRARCAPPVSDLRPTLAATDAGGLWFASVGSLVRSGLRLVPGDTIAISGDLDFPSGAGPFPAVILAHGCGGIGVVQTAWAQVLRQWGYATFVVDSFRGRGLAEVCTSAATLTGIQRIPDAYGALRVLATHPRIDARRVALMGFSHGGSLPLRPLTV